MLALLCFNSRFSIVLSAVVYILLNYKNMIYSRHRIKYVLCIGLTSAVFLYMLFNTSFGGRLLDLGLYGDASSMARTEILDIFRLWIIGNLCLSEFLMRILYIFKRWLVWIILLLRIRGLFLFFDMVFCKHLL